MSTNNDKRELLKLRQGLISEDEAEIIEIDVKPEPVVLHGKAKIENFFYHYKIHIIMTLFFSAIIFFFIYETVTKTRADIDFMIVTSTEETRSILIAGTMPIEWAVARFTPDFDGNGYVHAQTFPVNFADEFDTNMVVANQTKLFAEFQMGITRMFMGDRGAFDRILGSDTVYTMEDVFVNLSEIYPNNENIFENVFFKVKDSGLLDDEINRYCPDDMYIAISLLNRGSPRQEAAHERALEVLDNIINRNVVTEDSMIYNFRELY